jgi:hypothetical protein
VPHYGSNLARLFREPREHRHHHKKEHHHRRKEYRELASTGGNLRRLFK